MEMVLSFVTVMVVLRMTFSWFWPSNQEFLESLRLAFSPDIFDALRGQGQQSFWQECKVFLWLLIAISAGFSVHAFLTS